MLQRLQAFLHREDRVLAVNKPRVSVSNRDSPLVHSRLSQLTAQGLTNCPRPSNTQPGLGLLFQMSGTLGLLPGRELESCLAPV